MPQSLSILLILATLSLQTLAQTPRLLEPQHIPAKENVKLQAIVRNIESESDPESDKKLDNLLKDYITTFKHDKQQAEQIGQELKEVEIQTNLGADADQNLIFSDEDSPFKSPEEVTEQEQQLIDSVKLESSKPAANELERIDAENRRKNADRDVQSESSDESGKSEEALFQSTISEIGDIKQGLEIRSEDELINIDEVQEKKTESTDTAAKAVSEYPAGSESILEQIRRANMPITYKQRRKRGIDIKQLIWGLLGLIREKLVKKFDKYLCGLSICEGSLEKVEARLKKHLSRIMKLAFKCILLPQSMKNIKKLMDFYLTKCVDDEDQESCIKNKMHVIKKILAKSLWTVVAKIWNKSLNKVKATSTKGRMYLPPLGNNFAKKKQMDRTWTLGTSRNPVWWRQFRRNRDIAAQSFWRSHDSHARQYERGNAYYDWYNRRPWKYQMNGWGNRKYSPYSHSMGWMKHQVIAPVVVRKQRVLRNRVKVPIGRNVAVKYSPNIFLGPTFFNKCGGEKKCQ